MNKLDQKISNPVPKKPIETFDDKVRSFLVDVYSTKQEPQARFEAILARLAPFFVCKDDSGLEQSVIDEIQQGLEEYTKLADQEEAISKIIVCLKPLLMWQENNPKSFETRLRESFVIKEGFIPLNEMLSYGQAKDYVHIHLAPSKTLTMVEKLSLLKDGFKKLVDILRADPELKEVRATSWIVAANSGLLEKLGFTIKGEISLEVKAKYFRPEFEKNIPVHSASISSSDFINRWQ